MYNSNLNLTTNLYGEYRIKVLDNNQIVSDTGWCKNTILSSGLIALSSISIPDALSKLDLGLSNSLPGTLGYSLSGVVTQSTNPELIDVERSNLQTFTENLSTKVYVCVFGTTPATSATETIQEFAIKTKDGIAFARNTLQTPVTINYSQSLNFEYRLSTNWYSLLTVTTPFRSATGLTFFIPTTSVTYNTPYDRTYYNNNKLILLKNNEQLPSFGENYPAILRYAFNSKIYSTFSSTVLSSAIDNVERAMNVFEEYQNITCPENYGIANDINSALLVKDGDVEIPSNKFQITKFKFPLSLYDYKDITDINVLPKSPYFSDTTYGCYKKNILSLCYRYAWKESSTSIPIITTTITPTPSSINTCLSAYEIETAVNTNITVTSNSNRIGYRLNAGTAVGGYTLNFNTGGLPVNFTIVHAGVTLGVPTDYRGDIRYNINLENLGLPYVVGPRDGKIATFYKNTADPYIYVYLDTPLGVDNCTFNLSNN